ncbi:hypothetical protein ACH82I_08520 [Brevibacterium sp. GP-SGM9]|uniref:hypothetical protein n=1 Tax=Brevibacterium sp. GP-SGM9 TaxID=3376990 RepID=UPI0039A51B13
MAAGSTVEATEAEPYADPLKRLMWDLSTTGACTYAEHAASQIDGIVRATFSFFGVAAESVLDVHVTLTEGSDYVALIGRVTDDIIPRLEVSAGVVASEKRIEFSVAPEELTSISSAPRSTQSLEGLPSDGAVAAA